MDESKISTIITKKYLSDEQVKKIEGTWISEEYMKFPVLTTDADVYIEEDGTKKLLLKFRKNVISEELIKIGWDSYKKLAKPSRGRGAAAGPIDKTATYWTKRDIVDIDKWRTSYILKDGRKSKMKINNQVLSNPIGYYEKTYNVSKLPCRLTHFTRTNYENYEKGLPFIKKIDELYKKLVPEQYKKQHDRSELNPEFKIKDTSFSTITINRNFRTALHKDGGDYKEGFGNLTVIEKGEYSGGYTIFPQYGIAVDVRTNDFLAMDVHQWHSNTPIYETEQQKKSNDKLDQEFKENPKVGTAGIYKNYTRLTFVCYLREKLINCENEDSRFLNPSDSNKIK
jgi:hypothetical protein